MRRIILMLITVLGLAIPAHAEEAAPASVPEEQASKIAEHVKSTFGEKVIEPGLIDMLKRLFADEQDIAEEAQEAIINALYKQAGEAREILGSMIDAIANKDRAAFDTAAEKHRTAISSRKEYLTKAVKKLIPELLSRARPLARANVHKHYTCGLHFIGTALALDADADKAAKVVRKTFPLPVRRAMCAQVREQAEKLIVDRVDLFMKEMGRDLVGENVDLGKEGERLVAKVHKALNRELITIIGGYRESTSRLREGLSKIAETLPPAPAK